MILDCEVHGLTIAQLADESDTSPAIARVISSSQLYLGLPNAPVTSTMLAN